MRLCRALCSRSWGEIFDILSSSFADTRVNAPGSMMRMGRKVRVVVRQMSPGLPNTNLAMFGDYSSGQTSFRARSKVLGAIALGLTL